MTRRQPPFDPGPFFARVVGVGISLFLFAFALAFGAFFVRQVRHDLRVARAYEPARCTYVDRKEWPEGSPKPEEAMLVRYERSGKTHRAWVDQGRSYLEVEYPPQPPEAVYDDEHRDEADCWVDPDVPGDVVLGRTPWKSYAFGLIPLGFLAAGLVGLRLSLRRATPPASPAS